jgi:hypothetical protein
MSAIRHLSPVVMASSARAARTMAPQDLMDIGEPLDLEDGLSPLQDRAAKRRQIIKDAMVELDLKRKRPPILPPL